MLQAKELSLLLTRANPKILDWTVRNIKDIRPKLRPASSRCVVIDRFSIDEDFFGTEWPQKFPDYYYRTLTWRENRIIFDDPYALTPRWISDHPHQCTYHSISFLLLDLESQLRLAFSYNYPRSDQYIFMALPGSVTRGNVGITDPLIKTLVKADRIKEAISSLPPDRIDQLNQITTIYPHAFTSFIDKPINRQELKNYLQVLILNPSLTRFLYDTKVDPINPALYR